MSINNATTSLPFLDLPSQVLDIIVQKLTCPLDIAHLALASKSFLTLLKNSHLHVKLCGKPETVGPSENETAKCKRTLVSLTKQFPCIESLDLSSTNIADGDVVNAVQRLRNLKTLALGNCTKITITLPLQLYHDYPPYPCLTPSLESLNLSRCFQLTDKAISRGLQWSTDDRFELKALAFGKIHITDLNKPANVNNLIQHLEEIHFKNSNVQTQSPERSFSWSRLTVLFLNNVEGIEVPMLHLITTICPNLIVLGLGGSLVKIPFDEGLPCAYASVYRSWLDSLSLDQTNTETSAWIAQASLTAALVALVILLPKLWLLELTFFPPDVIDHVTSLILSEKIRRWSPQRQGIRIIDFNNAESVNCFYNHVAYPFRKFCTDQRVNAAQLDNNQRFAEVPDTFLDFMIHTASSTSRGGSMLSPNTTFAFSQTAMQCAAESGDEAHVHALIKSGVVLELRGRGSGSPLFKASKEGYTNIVLQLLEAHVNPLTANRHDETSLYIAALRGHEKIVDVIVSFCEYYCIDWRQNENYKDTWTPLMAAAVADRCNVAKCLLYASASSAQQLACRKNRYKDTALHIAAYRGCVEMVELLVKVGGRDLLNELDCYGRSALMLARSMNKTAVINILSDYSKDRNLRPCRTPKVDFRNRWPRWVTDRDCPLDYLNTHF